MTNISASFLLSGKSLISGALSGFSAVSIHSFEIGDVAGFTPASNDAAIRGSKVFTGYSGLVSSKMTSDDTVRHTLIIPESAGPFTMGNVLVYGSHIDGIAIPFMSIAFPFPVSKIRSEEDFNDSLSTPTPGTRFVINVDIKHSIFGEVLSVNVITPEFSSLASFATESQVPASNLVPWAQFVVNHDTRTGSPALVSKKSDGSYWGTPFHQNYRDPKFGIADGGNAGDGYKPSLIGIISGYYYDTPDEDYAGTIGGMPYEQQFDGNSDFEIGGVPYSGV